MGITALVVPMTLKLPVWIEAEVVIAAWWVIWGMALTLCLYNGWQVTHDFEKPAIASLTFATPADSRDSYGRGWWNGFLWGSSPDLGGADNSVAGCLVLIVLIILLPFIVVFLAEAAVFLAFVLYFMIRGMLAQVANSRLRCRGRLARSFAFGFFWATLYTVPLAGLVWVVHRVHS
jgi:hypothetical protein